MRRPRSKPTHIAGKAITGANYEPSCGACSIPPWEVCACSTLDNVELRNFRRVQSRVDVLPLLSVLQRSPGIWDEDPYWANTFPHEQRRVQTLMLRFPDIKNPAREDRRESIDYPHYLALPEARSLIMGLMCRVQGERLGGCFLNRVQSHGAISLHRDPPMATDYYERFHIVLCSNAAATFTAGGERVVMGAGEIWWFDASLEHGVENHGDTDRIHLVIDIRCKFERKNEGDHAGT